MNIDYHFILKKQNSIMRIKPDTGIIALTYTSLRDV